jgi:hypothetical protein
MQPTARVNDRRRQQRLEMQTERRGLWKTILESAAPGSVVGTVSDRSRTAAADAWQDVASKRPHGIARRRRHPVLDGRNHRVPVVEEIAGNDGRYHSERKYRRLARDARRNRASRRPGPSRRPTHDLRPRPGCARRRQAQQLNRIPLRARRAQFGATQSGQLYRPCGPHPVPGQWPRGRLLVPDVGALTPQAVPLQPPCVFIPEVGALIPLVTSCCPAPAASTAAKISNTSRSVIFRMNLCMTTSLTGEEFRS